MKIVSFIVAMIFTAFVFYMSSLSGEVSGELSGSMSLWVYHTFLEPISFLHLSFDTFHLIIRKLAHITEYFILGGLWAWTFFQNHFRFWIVILLGLLIACADESIQIISVDRGPSIIDALLFDSSSYVIGALITKRVFKFNRWIH